MYSNNFHIICTVLVLFKYICISGKEYVIMACGSGGLINIKPEYTETSFAVPLDIQRVEHALQIEPFLDYVENFIGSSTRYSTFHFYTMIIIEMNN